MRTCAKCGQAKEDDQFNRNGYRSDGSVKRHSYCRSCLKEYKRDWRSRNPDEDRATRRALKTPESELARKRRTYWANLDRSRKKQAEYRANNPDKVAAWRATRNRKIREQDLWRYYRHGVTLEDQRAILSAQGGACAICEAPLALQDPRTHVDHCHTNGWVRGLLCVKCNASLGWFETRRERVLAYLAAPPVHPGKQPLAKPPPEERALAGSSKGWPLKERCKNGHPLTDENVYVNSKTGARRCKICTRDYARTRWRAANPDAAERPYRRLG